MTFSILNTISTTPTVQTLLVPTILALLPLSSLFVQGSQNDNLARPERDQQLHVMSHPDVARNVKPVCQNNGLDGTKSEGRSSNQDRKGPVVSAGTLLDRELHEIDSMK